MRMKDLYLVLEKLAEEHRHILSKWRAHLLLRRHVEPSYPEGRAARVVAKLERDELVESIRRGVLYRVTSPYARRAVNVYELAAEAYPSGVLSHSSALELHRLTDQRSRNVHLYEGPSAPGEVLRNQAGQPGEDSASFGRSGSVLIPPGTDPAEWRLQPLPRTVRIGSYEDYQIHTHQSKGEWLFGYETLEAQGVAVRATDVERTLIDGLRRPEQCGGLGEVFRGWVRAGESGEGLSAGRLVEYTEQLGQLIVYQRVGFVMETLGLRHDRLAHWKEHKAPRGGSRVLSAAEEYSSEYSEEWNLSINHPISILTERDVSYS